MPLSSFFANDRGLEARVLPPRARGHYLRKQIRCVRRAASAAGSCVDSYLARPAALGFHVTRRRLWCDHPISVRTCGRAWSLSRSTSSVRGFVPAAGWWPALAGMA